MADALREVEIDHVIDHVPLKMLGAVEWRLQGSHAYGRVAVEGQKTGAIDADLLIDITVSITLPGKYTYQLRQIDGPILRRLDVRGTHTNRDGLREEWKHRTHKHRWRDVCGDAFAYTPTDIPPTDSPASSPNPGEHLDVFEAFCGECGIEPGDAWRSPPGLEPPP